VADHFYFVAGVCLVLCIGMTWVGPRYSGMWGIFAVHLFVLATYLFIAWLAIDAGRYEYHGILSMIGLLVQAFLLNCLLLPVALVAIWRRRRSISRTGSSISQT